MRGRSSRVDGDARRRAVCAVFCPARPPRRTPARSSAPWSTPRTSRLPGPAVVLFDADTGIPYAKGNRAYADRGVSGTLGVRRLRLRHHRRAGGSSRSSPCRRASTASWPSRGVAPTSVKASHGGQRRRDPTARDRRPGRGRRRRVAGRRHSPLGHRHLCGLNQRDRQRRDVPVVEHVAALGRSDPRVRRLVGTDAPRPRRREPHAPREDHRPRPARGPDPRRALRRRQQSRFRRRPCRRQSRHAHGPLRSHRRGLVRRPTRSTRAARPACQRSPVADTREAILRRDVSRRQGRRAKAALGYRIPGGAGTAVADGGRVAHGQQDDRRRPDGRRGLRQASEDRRDRQERARRHREMQSATSRLPDAEREGHVTRSRSSIFTASWARTTRASSSRASTGRPSATSCSRGSRRSRPTSSSACCAWSWLPDSKTATPNCSRAKLDPPSPESPRWDPGFACLLDDRDKPVVYHVDKDSPAEAAGVRAGMTVVSIDGKPAEEAIRECMSRNGEVLGLFERALSALSGRPVVRAAAATRSERRRRTAGARWPDARIQAWPPRSAFAICRVCPCPSAAFPTRPSVSWTMLDGKIGYVHVRRIADDLIEQLDRAVGELKDARGIIVDVRGNSGGGFDNARAHRNFAPDDGQEPERPRFHGPMAVLIDARCISAGEGWASWFVANRRATLLGEATAGASSRKTTYTLKNGLYAVCYPVKAYQGLPRSADRAPRPGAGRPAAREGRGPRRRPRHRAPSRHRRVDQGRLTPDDACERVRIEATARYDCAIRTRARIQSSSMNCSTVNPASLICDDSRPTPTVLPLWTGMDRRSVFSGCRRM